MYFAHTDDRRTSSASSTSIAHAPPPTSARLLGARAGFTAEWKPVVSRRLAAALASLSSPSLASLPAGKRSARSTEHDDRVARFRASSELASELSLHECARAVAATTTRVARNMNAAADALLYTFITWTGWMTCTPRDHMEIPPEVYAKAYAKKVLKLVNLLILRRGGPLGISSTQSEL